MALNPATIESLVKTAVKNALVSRFTGGSPPTDPVEIYEDVAEAVAAGVRVAVESIIEDAVVVVTDVAPGDHSATGTIG